MSWAPRLRCAGGKSGDGGGSPGSACVPVPSLVLLGLGARCPLCWGQEERQSKALKAWGGGSGPNCQLGKLCIPRALPGLPWQGV